MSFDSSRGSPDVGSVKETLGQIRLTFRKSMQRAGEMSPLSSGDKESKVTAGSESESRSPSSARLSSGSPVTSPLKNMASFFQKKEEEEKGGGLARSKTDPNMSVSLIHRAVSKSRSLRFYKKEKNKSCPQPQLLPETIESNGVEEEKEEVWEEMEEAYSLPEIPDTPISVMQINKLIEMEVLEEAHLNLLALRLEFRQELERCGDDLSIELAKKEKDLRLLYGELRSKISTIVRDSNSFPSRNKGLLVPVVRIIQEEERRAEEPGGYPCSWMEAWREAVGEGVRRKVENIHLELREQNPSWLAVHLGLLGKVIVEDLESVKKELRWSYPPSFKVFSTYVRSYHRVVGQHLKKVEQQVTEPKDRYALLDWIIHRYKSERIMGSFSLQPDMEDEGADLQLEENFLEQQKEKFCLRVKEDMRSSLDRIIELQNTEVWSEGKSPENEENFLYSEIHMDIWTIVKSAVGYSCLIDAELEQRVTSSCLEELKQFPRRFETEFRRHCGDLRPQLLWTQYKITYINAFTTLQQHMGGYRDACPAEVEEFGKEARLLIVRLMQDLEDQFKEDVKPYLRRMMTRNWLTNDGNFMQLKKRTELLSENCSLMRPPQAQELASRLHYHVAREYIGQLMKNNYSCKNRKHEKAAAKIRLQWTELTDLFGEMNSSLDWLHAVGDDLSNILTQKNKADIKNHLQPLLEHYPDFSRKHLVALLYFRGLPRGREHQLILRRLAALKKNMDGADGDRSRVLFGDMPVAINTDCLSNAPFCFFPFAVPSN